MLRDAASNFFASNGYAGTSTRAIASEAGVSETLLFRHFGTKSGLFEATTLTKFRVSVDEFLARWPESGPVGLDDGLGDEGLDEGLGGEGPGGWGRGDDHRAGDRGRAFLVELLRFFREQRGVMFALMTVDAARDEDIGSIQATALDFVDRVLLAINRHALTRPDGTSYPGVDPEVTPAVVASAMMSVVVLDDWLFREGVDRPSETAMDHEVIDYVLDGVAHRVRTS